MHFREKGNRIQFIRTTYDPKTRRSKYNLVGAMPRLAREVKPEVLQGLTEDEKKELYAFIENQKDDVLLEGRLYSHRLPHIVASIVDYARVADPADRDLVLAHMTRAALEFNGFVRKERR